MKNLTFRAFLDLLMVSDPWPLDQVAENRLTDFADQESRERGFENWIVAYHDFDGGMPDREENNTASRLM